LLISGSVLALVNAIGVVKSAKKDHDDQVSLVCAQAALMTRPSSIKSKYPNLPPGYLAEDEQVPLAKLGCSELSWTPSVREVLNASSPRDFSFTASFLPSLAFGLTATLAAVTHYRKALQIDPSLQPAKDNLKLLSVPL
jgi:hypothetical protein